MYVAVFILSQGKRRGILYETYFYLYGTFCKGMEKEMRWYTKSSGFNEFSRKQNEHKKWTFNFKTNRKFSAASQNKYTKLLYPLFFRIKRILLERVVLNYFLFPFGLFRMLCVMTKNNCKIIIFNTNKYEYSC